MKKFFLSIAAAAALVCSCSQNKVLDEKTFVITELNGSEYVPVTEVVPTISFSEGKLSANLGGNAMFTTYTEGRKGSLELSEIGMTRMLVPQEFREDEFVQALGSVAFFTLDESAISLLDKDNKVLIKAIAR